MKNLELLEMMKQRRSIRKYHGNIEIPQDALERVVEAGGYTGFSCNANAMSLLVVRTPEGRERIAPLVTWSHYLEGMEPSVEERPTAYIVPLMDTEVIEGINASMREKFGEAYEMRARRSFDVSYGMVIQAIVTQGLVEGLSSCAMAGINEAAIKEEFGIDPKYDIPTLIAMGYEKKDEKPIAQPIQPGESTRYYRGEDGILRVPKIAPEIRWE